MPASGPTLGFLVDTLSEDYQSRLFTGFNSEAVRLDVNVVCFVGGPLAVIGPSVHRNRIYECAGLERLHGLVVASGAIGNQVSQEALTGFVEGFQPLPVCSVGVAIPNCPSVTVDNEAGVREALVHLITEVGRRRIAFIRGPVANREAEDRYRAYREVLAEHRLVQDDDLVTFGDFQATSGERAVRTLIDERRMGFDAILAASDLMALGALNALSERGVPVPERVSVVGFDDIEAARYASLPLTTVRQPLTDLGKRALSLVFESSSDGSWEHTVLPARLVRRQSTHQGSESLLPAEDPRNTSANGGESIELAYRGVRRELFFELQREVPLEGLDTDWPEQLCSPFISEASGRRAGLLKRSTLEYLEHLLLRVVEVEGDPNVFQGVISRMRAHLRPLVYRDPLVAGRAEDLWHRARLLVSNVAERGQVQHRMQLRYQRQGITAVGGELLRTNQAKQFDELLEARLVPLGIPAAAVCAFDARGTARVLASFDATAPSHRPDAPFPQRQLLPEGVMGGPRRRTLIVETLYLENTALGYAVFEMGPREPETYELLRDYLTGALRGLRG